MNRADLVEVMEFARKKTLDLLDALAKHPEPAKVLGWRPGPGRAHIAWQLMHVAATDDRHLGVRMKGGEPAEPEYVRRFAGGSTPDDSIPALAEIRRYLTERRSAILDHLRALDEKALATKPNEQAPWTYHEWFKVLSWHEAHHQGQAHLTFNLYRATQEPALPKVGH
jgi:uncharacterized damage-inducible protein DinB